MDEPKTDRRSQRTRQLLRDALVELLLGKQYDAITVQDILDRANVGRSTFYGHYPGKEELLLASLDHVLNEMRAHVTDGAPGQHVLPSLEFFRHVKHHRRLYQALYQERGIDHLVRTLQAQLARYIEQNLTLHVATTQTPPAVPLSALAAFIANAFFTLLAWWLDRNPSYSPEQIDEMFRTMVYPGIEAVLGPAR